MPNGAVVWVKWGLKHEEKNGSDKWFMIWPKLKSSTFVKMAEMFDGCMGS
jgi:hypothetical protein